MRTPCQRRARVGSTAYARASGCCFTRVQTLPERGASTCVARIRAVRIGRWIIMLDLGAVGRAVRAGRPRRHAVRRSEPLQGARSRPRCARDRPAVRDRRRPRPRVVSVARGAGPGRRSSATPRATSVRTARRVAVGAHRCPAHPAATRPAHHRRRAARRTEIPSAPRRPGTRELGRPARASRPGRRTSAGARCREIGGIEIQDGTLEYLDEAQRPARAARGLAARRRRLESRRRSADPHAARARAAAT